MASGETHGDLDAVVSEDEDGVGNGEVAVRHLESVEFGVRS